MGKYILNILAFNVGLIVYFIVSLVFALIFVGPEDYIYYAVASLPVMLASMVLAKGDLIDPRVWFAFFGWLYSFSKTVLSWGGQYNVDDLVSHEAAYLQYIFYLFTVLSLWGFAFLLRSENLVGKAKVEGLDGQKKIHLKFIVIALCCYLLINAGIIFSSGLTSKRAISDEGVGLPMAGVVANILMVGYSLYLLLFYNAKLKGMIFFVGVVLFVSFLLTGERDLIAKFLLCTSFSLLYTAKIKKIVVYGYGFVAVFFFVLMKDIATYILSRGEYEFSKFDGLKWAVFRGDWASSGSNLEILLAFKYMIEDASSGLVFFASDIVSGVLPLGSRLVETTGSWYANNFLYYSLGREIGGLGFSYLGSWYVYLGDIGAIVGGIVYAFVSYLFYDRAKTNISLMAAYIAFTALAIWSLRVGFHGLLTSVVNQSLFPLLLICIILKCMRFKFK